MSSPILLNDLRYVLFRAEDPRPEYLKIYQETFRCWKEVWSSTLQELDGNGKIFSDDFCRQTLVGSILWKDRCLALGFYHSVNFESPTAAMDSYFKVWPQETLSKLTDEGKRVMVGSNITVDPAYRGDLGSGYRLKDLISGLMVKTFMDSTDDVMTGTMRCNRGMDRTAYGFGASPLLSGVIHHGVEVDLVAFYRSHLLKLGSGVVNVGLETLWNGRIDYRAASTKLNKKAV